MTLSALGCSGPNTRPASTPSAGLQPLPDKARELTTRYVRAWIEARHAEVQFFTAGYLVTVDYVAQPGPDGAVWCYPTLQAAEAAAVRAMRADKAILALPCPVERYKRALDEQLRWAEMVLGYGATGAREGCLKLDR